MSHEKTIRVAQIAPRSGETLPSPPRPVRSRAPDAHATTRGVRLHCTLYPPPKIESRVRTLATVDTVALLCCLHC